MARSAVILVVMALALAACSASGGASTAGTSEPTTTEPGAAGGASRAAFSVAWADEYVDLGNDDRCLSGRLVDLIGVERLNGAGITPEAFAAEEIFTVLEVDDAEREQITADVADAIVACSIAEPIAEDWLASDDEAGDISGFAPCVAEPLAQQLAERVVVEGWAGERTDSVFDSVTTALEIADAGCAELQVDMVSKASDEAGIPLTDSERACFLEGYQALAEEHRALTEDDDSQLATDCYGS